MNRAPRIDMVPVLLGMLGAVAGAALAFVRLAPNRLLDGPARLPWQAVPTWGWLPLVLWLAVIASGLRAPTPLRLRFDLMLATLLLLALPVLAAAAAGHALAVPGATARLRVQLGAGFWMMVLPAALLLRDRLARTAWPRAARAGWIGALVAVLFGYALAGGFDGLALAREFTIQRAVFGEALLRHLALVGSGVALALLTGAPAAWLAHRRPRAAGPLLGTLNVLQTVPSIALFALLIAPLAWLARHSGAAQALGIGGIGPAPAVIALGLYALLPVVRGALAGLDNVPAATIDAARGMGMGPGQILCKVQAPLAWPVWLAALRLVVVQAIGLAAVAALIGAGGLGRFVFLGLGQGATDLVLLGALAIVALALIADALFHGLQSLVARA